jgi:hypothetical protein
MGEDDDEEKVGLSMATKLVSQLLTAKIDESKNKFSKINGKILRSHINKKYEKGVADKIV